MSRRQRIINLSLLVGAALGAPVDVRLIEKAGSEKGLAAGINGHGDLKNRRLARAAGQD